MPSERDRLRTDLKIMRVAIERYYQDHGAYPGEVSDGEHDAGRATAVVAQLTMFSDAEGRVSRTYDTDHPFGPYLREGIPPCPVETEWRQSWAAHRRERHRVQLLAR